MDSHEKDKIDEFSALLSSILECEISVLIRDEEKNKEAESVKINLGDFCLSIEKKPDSVLNKENLSRLVTGFYDKFSHQSEIIEDFASQLSALWQEFSINSELEDRLNSELPLTVQTDFIIGELVKLVDAKYGLLAFFDEKNKISLSSFSGVTQTIQKQTLCFIENFPESICDTLTTRLHIQKSSLVKDKLKEFFGSTNGFFEKMWPILIVPIRVSGKTVGLFLLIKEDLYTEFLNNEIASVVKISTTLGNHLTRQKTWEALVENKVYEKELHTARLIQQSFLPPSKISFKGFDVFGVCKPAGFVGGDCFDYIPSGSDLYILIADVCGHGLSSAMVMSNFRTLIRYALSQGTHPSEILAKTNDVFQIEINDIAYFITGILLKLSKNSSQIEWFNFGHHSLLHFTNNCDEISEYSKSDSPVGLFPGELFFQQTANLQPGDMILLCTDGILEAKDAFHQNYDIKRLVSQFKRNAGESLEFISDNIISSISEYEYTKNNDDQTMVMIRYEG